MHETVFERESERAETGRVTRALWNRMEKDGAENPPNDVASHSAGRDLPRSHRAMAAGAGGLTSFLSLALGRESTSGARCGTPCRRASRGRDAARTRGGQQWQQYALEEQQRLILRDGGEDALDRAVATSELNESMGDSGFRVDHHTGSTPAASFQGLSEQDFDHLLFGGGGHGREKEGVRQDTAPAELAPFDGVDASLSPLSKHLAEHQRREDASRMTLTQQQALLQQQWEQNHAQDFRNDQLLRSKTENPAGTRNRNRRHPRTDRRLQHAPRAQGQRQQLCESISPRPRRRPARQGEKELPSYMRSTAATRLWKSSTEAEKRKPKGQRTEIY